MTIDRRLALASAAALGVTLLAAPAFAAAGDSEAVAKAVESFRLAQVAADAAALGRLCAEELSYSHSDGRIEDKKLFITNATAGKSKFLALEYRAPTVRIVGDVATVRFNWIGEQQAVADGKKTPTNLLILMTWIRQGTEWKLLSRGSTKL